MAATSGGPATRTSTVVAMVALSAAELGDKLEWVFSHYPERLRPRRAGDRWVLSHRNHHDGAEITTTITIAKQDPTQARWTVTADRSGGATAEMSQADWDELCMTNVRSWSAALKLPLVAAPQLRAAGTVLDG